MPPTVQNLFNLPTGPLLHEIVSTLAAGTGFRFERIVSLGHSTPPGEWYDQEQDEWVILLRGYAQLHFESGDEHVQLGVGDYISIPAHYRHRVEWTHPEYPAVWLALHYDPHDPK